MSNRGRCAQRTPRRALLALTSVLAVPATWAMGRAGSVWGLTLSTAAVWFLGGAGMALTGILAGLLAEETERGKAYGFLSLAGGIGTLVGGLFTGPLADRWGYPTMFALLGLFGATNWIGAIVGFAGTGNAVQWWGLAPTLIAGAALPLISILTLVPVRRARDDP